MERTRTYEWQDPAIGAKQAFQMNGIDYLHAMLREEIPAPPLMHTLDFNAERFEKGDCAFSFSRRNFTTILLVVYMAALSPPC